MYYSIDGLCPSNGLSGHGFLIKLFPGFKRMVAAYDLNQEKVNTLIDRLGQAWLDACGYGQMFDPDNPLAKTPGPNARRLYRPGTSLRVGWGEWGPEHITVPGNACGLDLSDGFGSPRNGKFLSPHNVDHWRQVQLLLVTFCWFAEAISLNWEIEGDVVITAKPAEGGE